MPTLSINTAFQGDTQQRYKRLVENINGIAWESDQHTHQITVVSGPSTSLLGYPLSQWLTPGFWVDHLHPDDRDRALACHQHVYREQHRRSAEYRMLAADGRAVWLRATVSAIVEEGVVVGLCGVLVELFDHTQTVDALAGRDEKIVACDASDYWQLQEREQRYREFFEHSPDSVSMFDVTEDGHFKGLDFNLAWEQISGLPRTALVGYVLDQDPDETTYDAIERLRACVKQRAPLAFEHDLLTQTGHWHMQTTLIPVCDAAGRIYRIISINRNITLLEQRDDLSAREARFRTFVDHAADAVVLYDEDGSILDANRQACECLGYSREELIGKSWMTFDTRFDQSAVEWIGTQLSTGEAVACETYYRRKDGSMFPVEVHIYPFQQGGRKLTLSLARDTSERKRAEQALLASYNLLSAVVEGTSDSIFVKDLQGRYLLINSAGARFLGKPAEQVIGRDDQDGLAPEYLDTTRARSQQVLATGISQTFEETITSAGVTRTYLSTKSVYRDSQGQVAGLISIRRDITELKRLEVQFRQTQKMEAVGRLASGVAHDFNNLLTVIIGNTSLVFESLPADDPNREHIALIQQASKHAATLTRQLLAFSRQQELQPQVADLNLLLGDLIKLLQRLLGSRITIALVPDDDLALTEIDPVQFQQAIMNLAVNARDAMPAGGHLIIETRNVELEEGDAGYHPELRPGRYIQVMVSDTGEGMDEATCTQIFEPFFTTKESSKGTGLGLAMVYGFVIQSGGHIEVSSAPKQGTTFTVYLPCVDELAPSMI